MFSRHSAAIGPEGFEGAPNSSKETGVSENSAAQSGAISSDFEQNAAADADLAAVIKAWPNLLASTKRRIVELATATVQQE